MMLANITRAVFLGFVSWITPRLAIKLGVPLDSWITRVAEWVLGQPIPSVDVFDWATWIIAFAVLGTEYKWRPVGRALDRLKSRRRPRPFVADTSTNTGIKIEIGTGVPFEKIVQRLHGQIRTLCVAVISDVPLNDCSLILKSISGVFSQQCPVIIRKGFNLNPKVPEYVPIAAFAESGVTIQYDPWIDILFRLNPKGSDKIQMNSYDLVFLASARECDPFELPCSLFVDVAGHLRLEQTDLTKIELIPYPQAVLTTLEELDDAPVGQVARGLNKDDPLGYYAQALFDGTTRLYGARVPSTRLSLVPNEEKGFFFFRSDRSALIESGNSKIAYTNLHIRRSDMERRISEMRQWDGTWRVPKLK